MKTSCIHILLLFLLFILFGYQAKGTNLFSNELSVLIEKAENYSKQEKYQEAIEVFNEALKITAQKNLVEDARFIHTKIAGIYYGQKEYEQSKTYYRLSIKGDSLSQRLADNHFNLSLVFRKQNQKDSLLFHLQRSLQIYDVLENFESKYSTYSKAGIILKNNGNYNIALRYLLKAYDGYKSIGNDAKIASICNTIGSLQRSIGNLTIAKQYYKEALRLRELIGDTLKLSSGYNNLANLYKAEIQYDSATAYYKKAIVIQNNLQHKRDIGRYYYNLGTVYYLQENLVNAEKNYKNSLLEKKKENDSSALSNSYNELALIAIKRKKQPLAKKYLDSAMRTLSIHQSKDVELRNYELQSEYYRLIDDNKKALKYGDLYIELYKSLFKEKQAKEIQELQERFESKQRLEKIAQLTEGNGIQKEVIEKQTVDIESKNRFLLIIGSLLVLAVALSFFIRQQQKIKERNLELLRLESIFKSQEVIKERISKDLHDIVVTSYDGIRLKIMALSNAKDPKKISEKIVNEISEINNEIRLISHRISPLGDKIKARPLHKIIIDQLTEFQYLRKIFVNIQLPLPSEIDNFNLESQTNFYGILLEALNNIEKHSQATEVTITHTKKNADLRFNISDNGVGFEDVNNNGIGLLNMKQRAELLNGICEIESSSIGTKVTLVFPIKPNLI